MSTTTTEIKHGRIKITSHGKRFCAEFKVWQIEKPSRKITCIMWSKSKEDLYKRIAIHLKRDDVVNFITA